MEAEGISFSDQNLQVIYSANLTVHHFAGNSDFSLEQLF